MIFLSLGFGSLSNSVLAETSPDPSAYVEQNFAQKAHKPLSKKDMVLKFILAMLGVAASSVVIYVILSMYNKVSNGVPVFSKQHSNLRTPENFKEAINSFLDKTDWD